MNRRGFLRLVGLAPVAGLAGAGLVKRRDPKFFRAYSKQWVVGVDPVTKKVGVYGPCGENGAWYRLW